MLYAPEHIQLSFNTDCLCRYLPWDSEFFGIRTARLDTAELTEDLVQQALDWCYAHNIDVLHFLASVADADTARLAERNDFQLVDVRVTLERDIKNGAVPELSDTCAVVRPCRSSDVPRLRCLAAGSHRDSRFYSDRHYPRLLCDELYATWIEKSCWGVLAHTVLVAELEGEAAGYVSCRRHSAGEGEIGLFAVAAQSQRAGLGRSLIEAALGWFQEQDINRVTVVTQGRNTKAQRLYQRCGFVTENIQLWYHRWFKTND